MNNFIRKSKGLGSQKCLAFQKAGSLLDKGCRGISVGGVSKRSSSLEFSSCRPFVGDSANTSSVRRNGNNVLLLTIRQPFYPKRHTPWESQSIRGEGEFVLSKL